MQPWLAGLFLHHGRATVFADVSGQGSYNGGRLLRDSPFQDKMDHPVWILEHQHPCEEVARSVFVQLTGVPSGCLYVLQYVKFE